MITYSYECRKCGTFDFVQSIKDDPLAICPTCGLPVHRTITRKDLIVWWVGLPFLKENDLM